MRTVIVIGLGTVAKTHLKALERIADIAVVAGVDTTPGKTAMFRDQEVPLYASVRDATTQYDPSLVVITTPTPTHAAICNDVFSCCPRAVILVEKPAADNLADVHQLLSGVSDRPPVHVAYHMAFSPEVVWAADLARTQFDNMGPPISISATFADPYETEFSSAQKKFGSSWIDSGINALSVLNRFVEPIERKSLRSLGPESWSTFEGRIECHTVEDDVEALILTSWHVTAPTRTTRIRYTSGAELVMDHHAVAGYVLEQGTVSEFFGSDGRVPRRESHYRALYDWLLVAGKPVMSAQRSLLLHNLLLRPESATSDALP